MVNTKEVASYAKNTHTDQSPVPIVLEKERPRYVEESRGGKNRGAHSGLEGILDVTGPHGLA